MENYTKLISRILIFLMFFVTIRFIVKFETDLIENIRINIFENNARGLVEQFNNLLWNKNQSIVKDIEKKESNILFVDQKFIYLAQNANILLKDLPVTQVNIYDINERKIFSNNPLNIEKKNKTNIILKVFENLFFYNIKESELFKEALNGKTSSQIIQNATVQNDESYKTLSLIKVMVPIINDKVTAIVEIYYDISKQYNEFINKGIESIVFSISAFMIFITILISASTKLEKMIEKQHEANMELAEAKEKAEAESIEKSKFLANISHELRTPLNAIIGFSEIIKTESLGKIGNQQYKEYANDINNSGTHLLSLINDILDYSKAEAKKLTVEAIEVDAAKILSSSMRLVKPRAEEANVKLIEDISKNSLILIADPKILKQAILNLLSNSVKFTPDGGSVTLSAKLDEEQKNMIIKVQDTGIGIADKDISKAMATFGQVDNKLSRKYEGTGLGLPLTKKLVELMKGKFYIESEVGFGTTVTLTFEYDKTKNVNT